MSDATYARLMQAFNDTRDALFDAATEFERAASALSLHAVTPFGIPAAGNGVIVATEITEPHTPIFDEAAALFTAQDFDKRNVPQRREDNFHVDIPAGHLSLGQQRYEADVKQFPNYHDGSPRKTWCELDEGAQRRWNDLPTVRHNI